MLQEFQRKIWSRPSVEQLLNKINSSGYQRTDTWSAEQQQALFVRSFVLFGQEPSLLWTPVRRPSAGPVRLPLGERRGIRWCVQCVRDVQERRDK